MTFKVGDLLKPKKGVPYNITRGDCILKVVKLLRFGSIDVQVMEHEEEYRISSIHTVNSAHFIKLGEAAVVEKKPFKYRLRGGWKEGIDELLHSKFSSTSSFASLNEDGTADTYMNTVCHSALNKGGPGTLFVVSRIDKEGRKKNLRDRVFYNWLIKISPYSSFIINTRYADAMRRGLIVRTDVPANLMVQALVVSRHPWEHTELIDLWYSLVKKGVHPNIAFPLVFFVREEEEDKWIYTLHEGNHKAISSKYLDLEFFKNFMKGEYTAARPNFYNNARYTGMFSLWNGKTVGSTWLDDKDAKNLVLTEMPTDSIEKMIGWDKVEIIIRYTSSELVIKTLFNKAIEIEKEIKE